MEGAASRRRRAGTDPCLKSQPPKKSVSPSHSNLASFSCRRSYEKKMSSVSPDLLRCDSSAGHCWSSMVLSLSCPSCAVAASSP